MGAGKMYRVPATKSVDRRQNKDIVVLKKKVKKLENQREAKRWDVQTTPNSFGWNGAVYPLNEVPVGDADYQREGSDLYMSSIDLLGSVEKNIALTACTVRILLVNLKLPRAANITWAEIAQDAVPSGAPVIPTQLGTALAPNFQFNFGTRHGFEVLYDKRIELNETTQNSALFHIKRKLNRKTYFNEATTDVEKNKLFFCIISDENGANEPLIEFTSRIYFQG